MKCKLLFQKPTAHKLHKNVLSMAFQKNIIYFNFAIDTDHFPNK